jgi:hypothetical protein
MGVEPVQIHIMSAISGVLWDDAWRGCRSSDTPQTGLAGIGHIVEEINDPSLQRILAAHDEKPFSLDQLLENFRTMSQVVCGNADVGPFQARSPIAGPYPSHRRSWPRT